MEPFLRVCDISYAYHSPLGATPALSGISFTVNKGEFLAIVGPSGCGKSTLLSLLAGLLTPEEGSVYIGDTPLKEAHAGIGYMLQRDHLFEWRTIRENAALGLEIRHRKTKAAMKTLDEMLENYGLAEFADAHPSGLSGGMRQRILLSMGIITSPNLLVVDEPTKAIDWVLRKDIVKELKALKDEMKCAMLFITHDLGAASIIADRIAVMYSGEIVETGPADEVLNNPKHPYTKGLISAMPSRGLNVMEGYMPSFTDTFDTCRFFPRCTEKTHMCDTQIPKSFSINEHHTVKCNMYCGGN